MSFKLLERPLLCCSPQCTLQLHRICLPAFHLLPTGMLPLCRQRSQPLDAMIAGLMELPLTNPSSFFCPPCRQRSQPLDAMIAGLMELLRAGGDSGGQAAARAIKNLSAGHASSAKVRYGWPQQFPTSWSCNLQRAVSACMGERWCGPPFDGRRHLRNQ